MVIGQPWSGRAFISTDNSGLGRWTESTLIGKDGRKITIICAYQVNKNAISRCGSMTAFAQQWHLLRLAGKPEPDPHKQLLSDLGARIDELKAKANEVIVTIDANDSLQIPNSSFTRWVRARKMVNVHVQKHGTDDEPPTYIRGSRCIDYILATEAISSYVTAAGILPFHEFCTSDHRALYADIAIQEFLCGEPNPIETAACRPLQSCDPRAVKTYREMLEKYLNEGLFEHNLNRAISKLKDEGYNDDTANTIDNLDQEITNVRLDIEAKCTKISSYPWSPTLVEARKAVTYWRLWLSELKLKRDLSTQRIKTGVEQREDRRPSYLEANGRLKTAQRDLKTTQSNAKELRRTHLKERAQMAGTIDDSKLEAAINRIIRAEAQKETFARLRRIMKNENRGALNHLQIQEEDDRVRHIYDQKEISDLLIEQNAKHFSQADGTPFTKPPLTNLFGKYGTNKQSKRLLDGKLDIDPIETTEAVKALLSEMKRVAPAGDVNSEVTSADVRSGYKKWRESTSTSPSGLHLGHEKALFKYEDKESKNKLSDRIFKIKVKLLNAAIEHGHVYSRWTKVVNAMIEKVPGKPLLSKLRVIHLIESDFNLLTGYGGVGD